MMSQKGSTNDGVSFASPQKFEATSGFDLNSPRTRDLIPIDENGIVLKGNK